MDATRQTPAPTRIRKSKDLLAVSAITFLTLSVWIGPTAACWLIGIAAFVASWVALCRKWPFVGAFTSAFLVGFLGGLFGNRGGYGYTYRTPHKRRR